MPQTYRNLPDPIYQPEFYRDVPLKRLIAWVIDAILITILTIIVVPLTAFTALFFLPILVFSLSFAYRVTLLANGSATLGMRMMAIGFRRHDGSRLDLQTAVLHTLLYQIFTTTVILQIVSIVLMLTDARGRGLPDMILGTVMINRAAGQ